MDNVDLEAAFREDREQTVREAQIPTSCVIWWRANIRARQQAVRATMRTAALLQTAIVLAAVVVAFLLLGPSLGTLLRWIDLRSALASFSSFTVPLLLAFAAWAVLVPMALYFAVKED